MQSCPFYKMDQKKSKNNSPRIKIIQKLYNALMNPEAMIDYPKSQYKKFIKDVVTGTLERVDLIEGQIKTYLRNDIDLTKTDKLLKIILFAAIFELMFKHNTPKKVIISEYLLASEHFLEKIQIGYLNAILDKISKELRKDD
jgi:N utilization substance protein B